MSTTVWTWTTRRRASPSWCAAASSVPGRRSGRSSDFCPERNFPGGCSASRQPQVVYYDHRGHGRSDRGSEEDWRLDVWADDVVRLCDALGIERPIVIGESFGGFVAQRYLARHPEHPSKVVLACTSPRLDIEVVAAAFGRRGGPTAASAARDFWTHGPEAILPYLEHCMPLYSLEPEDPDVLARAVMNLDVMGHFQAGEQRIMDLAPGLAAARCPVLVLAGELDPVCPVEMSEEIVAALVAASPSRSVWVNGRSCIRSVVAPPSGWRIDGQRSLSTAGTVRGDGPE